MLSGEKLCYVLAGLGLNCFAVRKVVVTWAEFIEHGTATPFTLLIEGEMGSGKTTFAINILLSTLAIYALHIRRGLEVVGVSLGKPLPSREKIERFDPEFYKACEALYEGDFDFVTQYVRKLVTFGPTELIDRLDWIVNKRNRRPVPVLVSDDAGIFFFRTGWIGFEKEWRRAVVKLTATLQLMRTFTAGFIITAPERKQVLSRLVDLMRYLARLHVQPQRKTVVMVGHLRFTTDRYVRYFKKSLVTIARRAAEAFVDIMPSLGKEYEPVVFVDNEITRRVHEDVWRIREEWIRKVGVELKELLEGRKTSEREEAEEEL